MQAHPLLLSTASALLLAACAGTGIPMPAEAWRETADTPAFEAAGRMAVQADGHGSHAHFDWLRTAQIQLFEINGPLGIRLGHVCEDSSGAQAATADGRRYRAENAAELSRRLLGYELPIAHIDRWAHGLRVAGEPHQTTPDGQLQQLGWRIRRHVDEQGRPRLLLLERPGLSLRLVFDHIGLPENPPAACPQ